MLALVCSIKKVTVWVGLLYSPKSDEGVEKDKILFESGIEPVTLRVNAQ